MEFGDLTDILRRNDPTVDTSSRTVELKNVSDTAPSVVTAQYVCYGS